ncbi:hypothetical protein LJR045_000966 [Microbacterium sp. LjRoot45]|uniref:hypothetical protein n=1 Tax=Microbacterium sp. LjRoot45 TaxID=3342329 RepID=UPI003ECFE10F
MIENMRDLWEVVEEHDSGEMAVVDHMDVLLILSCNEDGEMFYTRVRYEDDESSVGWVRDDTMSWPLRRLVPEPEPVDDTPCAAQMWSWDYFRSQQVDPYWMRCHLVGKHDEHENSETGARWPAQHESEGQGS